MAESKEVRFLAVKQLAALGIIPEGGIRHLIFSNPDFNKMVVRRVGRKILLDLEGFYKFIDQQGSQNHGGPNDYC